MEMTSELPRLALVSDVAPVKTQGGELLLYRLLTDYPIDKLMVVHGGRSPFFITEKLLPNVDYCKIAYSYSLPQLLRTRWIPFWRAFELYQMKRYKYSLQQELAKFRPQVILTLSDLNLWKVAAEYSRSERLPLVLVQHDDLASKLTGNSLKFQYRLTRWLLHRQLGQVYRQAAVRFAVSPGMAEEYERRYCGHSELLYPSRGEDSPQPQIRVRTAIPGEPPVLAFAGALHTQGARDLLRRLGVLLMRLNGRLDLYTQLNRHELSDANLDLASINIAGFFSPQEMAERIGATAHALFLPASFLAHEKLDISTLFPSKLADYTAIGLPILAWGPAYSSAARWMVENPGVGILETDESGRGIASALRKLCECSKDAADMAARGIEAGQKYFDHHAARNSLYKALRCYAHSL